MLEQKFIQFNEQTVHTGQQQKTMTNTQKQDTAQPQSLALQKFINRNKGGFSNGTNLQINGSNTSYIKSQLLNKVNQRDNQETLQLQMFGNKDNQQPKIKPHLRKYYAQKVSKEQFEKRRSSTDQAKIRPATSCKNNQYTNNFPIQLNQTNMNINQTNQKQHKNYFPKTANTSNNNSIYKEIDEDSDEINPNNNDQIKKKKYNYYINGFSLLSNGNSNNNNNKIQQHIINQSEQQKIRLQMLRNNKYQKSFSQQKNNNNNIQGQQLEQQQNKSLLNSSRVGKQSNKINNGNTVGIQLNNRRYTDNDITANHNITNNNSYVHARNFSPDIDNQCNNAQNETINSSNVNQLITKFKTHFQLNKVNKLAFKIGNEDSQNDDSNGHISYKNHYNPHLQQKTQDYSKVQQYTENYFNDLSIKETQNETPQTNNFFNKQKQKRALSQTPQPDCHIPSSYNKMQKINNNILQNEIKDLSKTFQNKNKFNAILKMNQQQTQDEEQLQPQQQQQQTIMNYYYIQNTLPILNNINLELTQQFQLQNNKKKESFINLEDFEIGEKIGTGSYAVVKLAIDKKTKQKYAIKIYQKEKLLDPHKLKNVNREIKILSKVNHPNIIKLFYVIDQEETLNLVMEFVGFNSMYSYLKQNSKSRLPEEKVRKIFKQIADGIHYLHQRCIVHRDIKLENLLLDEQLNIKIIDFGFSVCVQNDQKLSSFCGTPSYMAPEIVSKKPYIGPPVDIWCLGILLYVLMCGNFPFKGLDEKDLYKKIIKGSIEIPNHVPIGAKFLITKLLRSEPVDRLTSDQVLQDPWVLGIFSEKN